MDMFTAIWGLSPNLVRGPKDKILLWKIENQVAHLPDYFPGQITTQKYTVVKAILSATIYHIIL